MISLTLLEREFNYYICYHTIYDGIKSMVRTAVYVPLAPKLNSLLIYLHMISFHIYVCSYLHFIFISRVGHWWAHLIEIQNTIEYQAIKVRSLITNEPYLFTRFRMNEITFEALLLRTKIWIRTNK